MISEKIKSPYIVFETKPCYSKVKIPPSLRENYEPIVPCFSEIFVKTHTLRNFGIPPLFKNRSVFPSKTNMIKSTFHQV